ncbi:MAG: hypothetical protein ACK4GL_09795 [Flavobacteriales bacterium]
MKRFFYVLVGCLILFSSCQEEIVVMPDNQIPDYSKVPTVKIRNYVNRIFIDLIGREPNNIEMDQEVARLRSANLSNESRKSLIEMLMSSTEYVEGDSSYQLAYFKRIYELSKIRFLEGASDQYIQDERNIFLQRYLSDSLGGNMVSASEALLEANNLKNVVESRLRYQQGEINIMQMYAYMLQNSIYDFINMNAFNFVNAAFNDLLFRFPTQTEFLIAYEMVENDQAGTLFQMPGINKSDFIQIMINAREAHQGVIIWLYTTLLARQPSTAEIDQYLNAFFVNKNLQHIQTQMMMSDEYANF